MEFLQTLILALIQGLTEFLPVSSSAHLLLPAQLLGWPDQGLAFDVAVHLGTLAAVILYFRRDLWSIGRAGLCSCAGQWSADGRLAWLLVLATLPAAIAGVFAGGLIEDSMRSVRVITIATIGGGILLWLSDHKRHTNNLQIADIGWRIALIIGLAQVLALIPGVSRSGITITAALFLGLARQDAARFSFILSVPIIALSGVWLGVKAINGGDLDWIRLSLAAVVSFGSALACIYAFLRLLDRIGMMPFVIYRIALGLVLLAFLW